MHECKLGALYTTDLPRQSSWTKTDGIATQFSPETMTLNELGIIITAGQEFPQVVRDGHHRVSRLLEHFGADTVVRFEPVFSNAQETDIAVEINAACGVTTLSDFLLCCIMQNFISEDSDLN